MRLALILFFLPAFAAAGRYVMPGLINMHGHLQDEQAGIKMPREYQRLVSEVKSIVRAATK